MPSDDGLCHICEVAHLIAHMLNSGKHDELVVESAEVLDCGRLRVTYRDWESSYTAEVSVDEFSVN